MNDQKKDDNVDKSSAGGESKLDKWIHQTLQLGNQKPGTKIVHDTTPVANRQPQNTKPPIQKSGQHNSVPHKLPHPHKDGQITRQAGPPAQNRQQGKPRGGFFSKFGRPLKKQPDKFGAQNFGHRQKQTFGQRPELSQREAPGNRGTPAGNSGPSMYASARQSFTGKLRIIPFGGLNEVGKNSMALEYIPPEYKQTGFNPQKSEIIIIDLGFQFPDEDMLGVDYILPDTSYLDDKLDRIRGIVFTHGHLDHIGAVPYLYPKLKHPQMYGTRLTMGLIEKRLDEFGLTKDAKINVITQNDLIKLGSFEISFFAVNHSIPDSVGVVVKTPAGNIVHTGDFKFDHTPSGNQKPADFSRIGQLAYENIGALFIDSTNALKPGHTVTEKKIGESLEAIIKNTEGRILIASFSSQIGRIQQIIDAAKKHGRQIFLSGRSLIDNVIMASKLGYLRLPQGLVHDIRKVKKIPDRHALILTTGSQGEDVSSLTRMALEEHDAVKIKKGDTVVLSSSPIPGNERAVTTVTNNLCRLGAAIINNQIMDVHASGHAQQEDLKLMMSLVRAKYVVPVHGEYHMRFGNKEIALNLGYDEKHGVLIENGDVMEIINNECHVTGEKVENKYILVDGLGVGDIGAQVIMDRQQMAENGVLIVLIPTDEKSHKIIKPVDIISRGFVYMTESEELINGIKEIAKKSYTAAVEKRSEFKRGEIKKYVRESMDKFVHQKIERHPLILPVIIEL